MAKEKYWENGSGYYDPTAKAAIESETSREQSARNKQVHNTIREVKNMLEGRDLELIDRITLRDKINNKEYK